MNPTNYRLMPAALVAAVVLASAAAAPAKYWNRGGASQSACVQKDVEEALTPSGRGAASARLRMDDRCRLAFRVEAQSIPSGDYALVVGGVTRGTIAVRQAMGGVRGEIEFESGDDDRHARLLDFDPLGAVVEIRSGASVLFQALFDGVSDAPAGTPTPTRTAIPTDRATRTPASITASPSRTRTGTPASAGTAPATRTRTPSATGTAATPIRTRTDAPRAAEVRVTCERRSNRSRISVDGSNLPSGTYRARVVSGASSATAAPQATVGDEVEFDFDSDAGDVAAGATAIAGGFIQGTPAQVTGTILDSSGNAVGTGTATCALR